MSSSAREHAVRGLDAPKRAFVTGEISLKLCAGSLVSGLHVNGGNVHTGKLGTTTSPRAILR